MMPVIVPRATRLLRSPNTWCVVALFAAFASLWVGGINGLKAEVTVRPPQGESRIQLYQAAEPVGRFIEETSALVASTDVAITWSGVLWVPQGGVSEIGVGTAGAVKLSINGTVVVERAASPLVQESWSGSALQPGANRILLEYARQNGRPNLQLRWKLRNARTRVEQIPAEAFSPGTLTHFQALVRHRRTAALWVAALAWLTILSVLAARALARVSGTAREAMDTRTLGAMAFCALLFAAGIGWGWPGAGWAPDELEPELVTDAWEHRFTGGWHDKYPPVSYYVFTVAYAPILVAERLDRASTIAESVRAILVFITRLGNLLLSLGTVWCIGLLAIRLGHRRDAWLAMILAAAFLPMTFYARTANVDATYLFWFALSLVFFAAADRAPSLRDSIGLGVTAGLAVATKDHAYSLYVLPGLFLLGRCVLSRGRSPRASHLFATAVAVFVTWAVAQNVLFNFDGFRDHVRLIVGPASADFRMYGNTLPGQAQLLRVTVQQVWFCLSWAGVVAVVLGMRTRHGQQRLPAWLWLSMISSYFSLFVLVGYTYDRFLLPLTLACAVPAAIGIGQLLATRTHARWRGAAGALLLGWIVMRAVGYEVLTMTDARYAAESFLQKDVPPDAVIGSVGQRLFLPRLEHFFNRSIAPGIEATLAQPPDYIVLNTELMHRYDQDPVRVAWMTWLQSGHGPYREVFRYKAPMPWYSPIRFDSRFSDRVEDLFSNLDKVNPEIAIFKRSLATDQRAP